MYIVFAIVDPDSGEECGPRIVSLASQIRLAVMEEMSAVHGFALEIVGTQRERRNLASLPIRTNVNGFTVTRERRDV